mgnify:CR=1 FL=1
MMDIPCVVACPSSRAKACAPVSESGTISLSERPSKLMEVKKGAGTQEWLYETEGVGSAPVKVDVYRCSL